MKKCLILIIAAMLLTACSSESLIVRRSGSDKLFQTATRSTNFDLSAEKLPDEDIEEVQEPEEVEETKSVPEHKFNFEQFEEKDTEDVEADQKSEAVTPIEPVENPASEIEEPEEVKEIVEEEPAEEIKEAEIETPPDNSQDINTDLVWISDDGERYHCKKNCSNMQNNVRQVTREEAINVYGRTPCGRCKPR